MTSSPTASVTTSVSASPSVSNGAPSTPTRSPAPSLSCADQIPIAHTARGVTSWTSPNVTLGSSSPLLFSGSYCQGWYVPFGPKAVFALDLSGMPLGRQLTVSTCNPGTTTNTYLYLFYSCPTAGITMDTCVAGAGAAGYSYECGYSFPLWQYSYKSLITLPSLAQSVVYAVVMNTNGAGGNVSLSFRYDYVLPTPSNSGTGSPTASLTSSPSATASLSIGVEPSASSTVTSSPTASPSDGYTASSSASGTASPSGTGTPQCGQGAMPLQQAWINELNGSSGVRELTYDDFAPFASSNGNLRCSWGNYLLTSPQHLYQITIPPSAPLGGQLRVWTCNWNDGTGFDGTPYWGGEGFTPFNTQLFIGNNCPFTDTLYARGCVASNDNTNNYDSICGNGDNSEATLLATKRTYYVLVGNNYNEVGSYELHFEYVLPTPSQTATVSTSPTASFGSSQTPSLTATPTKTSSRTRTPTPTSSCPGGNSSLLCTCRVPNVPLTETLRGPTGTSELHTLLGTESTLPYGGSCSDYNWYFYGYPVHIIAIDIGEGTPFGGSLTIDVCSSSFSSVLFIGDACPTSSPYAWCRRSMLAEWGYSSGEIGRRELLEGAPVPPADASEIAGGDESAFRGGRGLQTYVRSNDECTIAADAQPQIPEVNQRTYFVVVTGLWGQTGDYQLTYRYFVPSPSSVSAGHP